MYILHCSTDAGDPVELRYDPHTSELLNPDGTPVIAGAADGEFEMATAVSPASPGRKTNSPRNLKIQLGLRCNYSCSYCSQSNEIDTATVTKTADAAEFLGQLGDWLAAPPSRIEFWGGEPFLYFAKLKVLVPELSRRFPQASLLIITNGSLIDEEIIDFIERYDIEIAVSHDGPAQFLRGADPFEEPERARWLRELWRRRGPPKRMSFNIVLTAKNRDISANRAWFVERVGDPEVALSTEGAVAVYDTQTLGGSGSWSAADYAGFRASMIAGFVGGDALRFGTILEKSRDFIDSLHQHRPSAALGQKCGMDREDELAVDLKGNVMTCQNTGAQGKHGIGSVAELAAVRLDTSTHWSGRECCNHCPVLQLCKGSCMYLEGDLFAQSCENEYHYNSAILAGILKRVTGLNLERFSGDIRRPRQGKPFPIRVATS